MNRGLCRPPVPGSEAALKRLAPLALSSAWLVFALACGGSSSGGRAAPPSGLEYSTPVASYTVNLPIAANVPSLTSRATSWSVTPALPSGLALDPVTGTITGTPDTLQDATDYTVTATNAGGSTTATISITVHVPPPSDLSYSANPAAYVAGTAIASNVPSVTGTVTTWSVAPALPSGLVLDPVAGTISGTPDGRQAPSVYAVTASNTWGWTSAPVTVEVVEPPSALALVHTPGSRVFTFSWTGGAGAGDCKLQYATADGAWHDLAAPPVLHDGSGTLVDEPEQLPSSDGWTDDFDATGVPLRVVRAADGLALATFAERATCLSSVAGSAVPTPDVDEDCDARWDNVVGVWVDTGTKYNCFPESAEYFGTWDPSFNPDPAVWKYAHVDPAAYGPGGGSWRYHPAADQLYGCRWDWYEWWAWVESWY